MKALLLLCSSILCCMILEGCAHKVHDPALWDLPPSEEGARLSASTALPQAPVLMWHAVRLVIPGKRLDESFSGALKIDPAHNRLRAVGMGGFGLKAFDLTVTPDSAEVHYLHPGLARIRGMSERIAFCLRRVWLTGKPSALDGVRFEGDTVHLYGREKEVLLDHSFRNGRLAATEATGPAEQWRIIYDGYLPEHGQPTSIVFEDGRGNYTVWIRLVSQ